MVFGTRNHENLTVHYTLLPHYNSCCRGLVVSPRRFTSHPSKSGPWFINNTKNEDISAFILGNIHRVVLYAKKARVKTHQGLSFDSCPPLLSLPALRLAKVNSSSREAL